MGSGVNRHETDQLNQAITGDYRRLSMDMRTFLGIDYLDWCGFAAWSSYTIGASIGDIDRPNNAFHQLPWMARLLTKAVRRYLRGGDGVDQLVDGNIAIYTEMRVVYEGIIASDPRADTETRTDEVLDAAEYALRAAQPITEVQWESVRMATRCYLSTLEPDTDEQRRCELVLAAAAHFSAFEQSRVDVMLDEFMYAPGRRFRGRMLRWVPGDFADPARRTFLEAMSTWFFTRFLTILVTASGPLVLGKRFMIPDPSTYRGGENPLARLTVTEATEALACYGDELRPDIADWSSFEQRMRVIVAYFRSYQHVPEMVTFDRLPCSPAMPPELPLR